ncbi:MAG: glucose-1-phosphate adenylyltransferase [Bacillales bacterium]|jgi:glucose-1-phosphate adenylyltransferase|nr:glucose-1-phosphate adenylyltransferase [Bacillales bacterium]
MPKKEMIAMLLAGGKGTRLEALTKKVAKPAVFFGGKYRIIDFALSNCSNSGVNVVGILTQYESIILNGYIGAGTKWGLDGNNSKTVLLSPRQKETGFDWFNGTASAIYQNIDFMDSYDPDYVLILSADHIYRMDYSKMLKYHKDKKADLTIAVLEVSKEEAHRFGIMSVSETGQINKFEEKPKIVTSTLASMGVYIFTYSLLRKILIEQNEIIKGEYDFGKHVIPKMLMNNNKLFAYSFNGYWKDVGTIASLWDANMDLIDNKEIELFDKTWKIYSADTHSAPQMIKKGASVKDSLINQGCIINGTIKHSIIFSDVEIGAGSVIEDAVILPNIIIGKNVKLKKVIVNQDLIIPDNFVSINEEPILIEKVG